MSRARTVGLPAVLPGRPSWRLARVLVFVPALFAYVGSWLLGVPVAADRGVPPACLRPAAGPGCPDGQPQDQADSADYHQDLTDRVQVYPVRYHRCEGEPKNGAHRDQYECRANLHDAPPIRLTGVSQIGFPLTRHTNASRARRPGNGAYIRMEGCIS